MTSPGSPKQIISNSQTVLATYTFRIAGTEPTEWQAKGVAVAGFTLATVGKSDNIVEVYPLQY